MSRRQPWADYVPTPSQIEDAVTDVINGTARNFDALEYFEWLATQGEVREQSQFFGLISNDEMLRLLVNPDATAEQCKAIGCELRKRFADHHLEGITEEAKRKAMRDFPEDVRARLEAV